MKNTEQKYIPVYFTEIKSINDVEKVKSVNDYRLAFAEERDGDFFISDLDKDAYNIYNTDENKVYEPFLKEGAIYRSNLQIQGYIPYKYFKVEDNRICGISEDVLQKFKDL